MDILVVYSINSNSRYEGYAVISDIVIPYNMPGTDLITQMKESIIESLDKKEIEFLVDTITIQNIINLDQFKALPISLPKKVINKIISFFKK